METIRQIEAAVAVLPQAKQLELLEWLEKRLGQNSSSTVTHTTTVTYSVLDIPKVNVGEILSLDAGDDGLLGEMLEQ